MFSRGLVDELVFYRRYHRQPVNVMIHVVCIPLILVTSLFNLTRLALPGSISKEIGVNPEAEPFMNFSIIVGFYYWIYYTVLDTSCGFMVGTIVFALTIKFSQLNAVAPQSAHLISWAVWGIGWIAQFIGHGIFEKRAPALFSNLQQALVLAPYFAFLEVISFLGFRKDLMAAVDKRFTSSRKAS